MKYLLLILFLAISGNAAADETKAPEQQEKVWVDRWWKNEYEKKMMHQQRKEASIPSLEDCLTQKKRYSELLEQKAKENEDSIYFQYKLGQIDHICSQYKDYPPNLPKIKPDVIISNDPPVDNLPAQQ